MSNTLQILAIVPAAFLFACQPPVEAEDGPQAAGQASFALRASAPVLYGALSLDEDRAAADVSVCLLDSNHCTNTDEFGMFKFSGFAPGDSEALVIEAKGYASLVLPFEIDAGEHHVEVRMVSEEERAVLPGTGTTRFSAQGRDGAAAGTWVIKNTDLQAELAFDGANAELGYMRDGGWTATFAADSGASCETHYGWGGPDAGVIAIPVVEGAITLIKAVCG
ncbi:MAG: hypothetical protein KDA24_19660 [Deltaproteobacteria bacterium]|nr:hypothetical protein [Deltaproteobacteria bacterium]